MPAPRTPLALLPEMQLRYEGQLFSVTPSADGREVTIAARPDTALAHAPATVHGYLKPHLFALLRMGYAARSEITVAAGRPWIRALVVREAGR
jgi:hypothetical protein